MQPKAAARDASCVDTKNVSRILVLFVLSILALLVCSGKQSLFHVHMLNHFGVTPLIIKYQDLSEQIYRELYGGGGLSVGA